MPIKYPIPPPSKARLYTLFKERRLLWNTVNNPYGLRLGNKILKARFRAQQLEDYYPPKFNFTPRKLKRLFPGMSFEDEKRDRWEEMNYRRRKRGKGPPPRSKTADVMREQQRLAERKEKAETAKLRAELESKGPPS